METTDRLTVRAIAAVRRTDVANVVEAQAAREVAGRRCRPKVAVAADKAETADVVVAITRSRIPDGTCGAELTGEVHAFIGTVVK